jgi:hypothetical protein
LGGNESCLQDCEKRPKWFLLGLLGGCFGSPRIAPILCAADGDSEGTGEFGWPVCGNRRHATKLHQDPGPGFWTDRAIEYGRDGYHCSRRHPQFNRRSDAGRRSGSTCPFRWLWISQSDSSDFTEYTYRHLAAARRDRNYAVRHVHHWKHAPGSAFDSTAFFPHCLDNRSVRIPRWCHFARCCAAKAGEILGDFCHRAAIPIAARFCPLASGQIPQTVTFGNLGATGKIQHKPTSSIPEG